jgi:hypothetical protein
MSARFREGLVADLAEGRLPLREAAVRLSDYLGELPPMRGFPQGRDRIPQRPGATPEERCAAELVSRARDLLPRSPGSAERVARLERELSEAHGR